MPKRKKLDFDTESLAKNLEESKGKGVDALFSQPSPTPPAKPEKKVEKKKAPKKAKKQPLKKPKKDKIEVKEIRVTLPLPASQLAFLEQMERDVFVRRSTKNRSKQRLTKNSILRAWISALEKVNVDIHNIEDEADLQERILKALSQIKEGQKI